MALTVSPATRATRSILPVLQMVRQAVSNFPDRHMPFESPLRLGPPCIEFTEFCINTIHYETEVRYVSLYTRICPPTLRISAASFNYVRRNCGFTISMMFSWSFSKASFGLSCRPFQKVAEESGLLTEVALTEVAIIACFKA